jgi:predicted ATPase
MAGFSAPKASSRSPILGRDGPEISNGRRPAADFLSHSHGEGFLRFFEERCQRQGIFIFDEPESALSPSRQIAFLKADAADGRHRPLPDHHGHALADADGYPNATLLRLTKYGLEPVTVKDTDHYKVMREFCEDPKGFVDAAIVD